MKTYVHTNMNTHIRTHHQHIHTNTQRQIHKHTHTCTVSGRLRCFLELTRKAITSRSSLHSALHGLNGSSRAKQLNANENLPRATPMAASHCMLADEPAGQQSSRLGAKNGAPAKNKHANVSTRRPSRLTSPSSDHRQAGT